MARVATGVVRSVNVSPVRTIDVSGEAVPTGILKMPVAGRVALGGVNLEGDEQADRSVHGGPDRAVYAYANEDYAWWSERLRRELAPGTFGENLTLHGVDVSGALIGERWRVGSTVLAVTSPRVPCFKLAHVMNDPGFVKAFAQALRPGAYLRVIEEGAIGAGDAAVVTDRPSHGVTIAVMTRIFLFERSRAHELLEAPELPDGWREWALERKHSGSS